MSEIRKVEVEIKDEESILSAIETLKMTTKKVNESIYIIENHGITNGIWGNVILKKENEKFLIVGDTSKSNLENLNKKIKKQYTENIIEKAAKDLKYTIVDKKTINGKIKIKLRTFA